MPFYDLHCADCGGDFNIRASVAEKMEKQIACPECGSHRMETVYSTVSVHLNSGDAPACPNFHACGGACPHAH